MQWQSPEELASGTEVCGWRVLGRLGVGGHGAVYRVEEAARPGAGVYALKLALRARDGRLERELGLLVRRSLPHLARALAYGRWPHPEEGFPFLVMEYVEGPGLAEWAETHNPRVREVAHLFAQLALTLHALHEEGCLHRDVKPDNVLVRSRDGQPVLLDFSAGDCADALTLTRTPLPPGSPCFRSPESMRFLREHLGQAGARYTYRPTDDLYALGVSLFRVLTGHYPFPSHLPYDVLCLAIESEVPPAPALFNPRVPQALAALVMRLLAKRPEARFQSGLELHQALLEAPSHTPAAWDAHLFEWEDAAARRIRRPLWPHAVPSRQHPASGLAAPLPLEHRPPAKAAPALDVPPSASRLRRWPSLRGAPVPLGVLLLLTTALVGSLTPGHCSPTLSERASSPHSTAPLAAVAPAARSPEAAPVAAPPLADLHPAAVALATHPKEGSSMKIQHTAHPHTQAPPLSKRPLSPEAAALAACLLAGSACSGVQLQPSEERCPAEALAAMKALGVQPGHSGVLVVDIQQPGSQGDMGTYRSGPIVSRTTEDGDLPEGILLYGRLWTESGLIAEHGGEQVFGQYTEAKLPDGRTVPVCIALGGALHSTGLYKHQGSQPHATRLPRQQPYVIVKRFGTEH